MSVNAASDSSISSVPRLSSKTSIRNLFGRGRSPSTSRRPSTAHSRSTTVSSVSSSDRGARPESPHLSRVGSKLDSYRPTQITHAAHIERHRQSRRRINTAWDPPPLFQAYPQSLKHATLNAPCLPIDSILRSSHSQEGGPSEAWADSNNIYGDTVNSSVKKGKEPLYKHSRKLSASLSSSGWTKQLFVLLTSGYLLQYTGDGHHDRLPEKMMQLGRNSVAFASDAIPGKHWVLQVSKAPTRDDQGSTELRGGILSRLGLQSAESRRTTEHFLLVFDNPADLDSWLITIRREIEALGGHQYHTDGSKEIVSERALDHRLGHKFRIQHEPFQFPRDMSTQSYLMLSPVVSEFPESDHEGQEDEGPELAYFDSTFFDAEPVQRISAESSSMMTSTDLDRLRDSKDSTMSMESGTRTSFNSYSPSFSAGDDTHSSIHIPPLDMLDASTVIDAHIESAQKRDSWLPIIGSAHSRQPSNESISPYRSPVNSLRATSAPSRHNSVNMRNFSVPISSKRASFINPFEEPIVKIESQQIPEPTPQKVPMQEKIVPQDEQVLVEQKPERPISTIAPLPTLAALKSAGTRSRSMQRRRANSNEQTQTRVSIAIASARDSAALSNVLSSIDLETDFVPRHLTSLDITSRTTIAPKVEPMKRPLIVSRSISDQNLVTIVKPPTPSTGWTLYPPNSDTDSSERPERPERPISLSGFPEPPQTRHAATGKPTMNQNTDTISSLSSISIEENLQPSRLPLSSVKSKSVPISSNRRLAQIRERKGLSNLGLGPPVGPPPCCPLPDTPSPSKRHFHTLSERRPSNLSRRIEPVLSRRGSLQAEWNLN